MATPKELTDGAERYLRDIAHGRTRAQGACSAIFSSMSQVSSATRWCSILSNATIVPDLFHHHPPAGPCVSGFPVAAQVKRHIRLQCSFSSISKRSILSEPCRYSQPTSIRTPSHSPDTASTPEAIVKNVSQTLIDRYFRKERDEYRGIACAAGHGTFHRARLVGRSAILAYRHDFVPKSFHLFDARGAEKSGLAISIFR